MPIPDIYCEIMVATAAPKVPCWKTATNTISNIIFNMVEIPKNIRGRTELPIAFKYAPK